MFTGRRSFSTDGRVCDTIVLEGVLVDADGNPTEQHAVTPSRVGVRSARDKAVAAI